MDDSKTIDENVDEFTKLVADLENLDVKIDEEDQAIFLLNSLPKQYDQLRDNLKYGKQTLSLEEVMGAAYSKELDLKANGKHIKQHDERLNVRGRFEKREGNQNKRGKSRSKSRGRKLCWVCNKEGHFRRECPQRKTGKNKGNESKNEDLAAVSQEFEFDSAEVLSISINGPKEERIIDSRCTFHMTPRRHLFFEYKSIDGGSVLMGNNMTCSMVGIGSIKFKMWDGTIKILVKVRHIPDLTRNLFSLGMLEKKGYNYKSEGGVLRVMKGSLVVMKGLLQNGLYVLQGSVGTGETATTEASLDKTLLWHNRLGHMSLKGLVTLDKHCMLDNKDIKDLEFCEDCILGKAHGLKFDVRIHRTKATLDYTHSHLWGSPTVPPLLFSCQYFVSFVDDYSRKTWIYFLRTKDEAFQKFVEWKILIENQTGKKIRRLRTDNGLEFCNNEFDKYCAENGISKHHTVRGIPQQNGLVERLNKTIMDKFRL